MLILWDWGDLENEVNIHKIGGKKGFYNYFENYLF